MNDFITKIENAESISVFLTQDGKEIIAFNGDMQEIVEDSDIINLDLGNCEITIDKSWGIMGKEDGNFVFNCGNEVWLYIDILT